MAIEDAIHELRTEMREGFDRIERRLGGHDARFEAVEARLDGHDLRFKSIDARFDSVDAEFKRIRAEIRAEGEATRRHFDMVAEQMNDSIRVVAEGTSRNAERLDYHETRLRRVERKSK
jgi:chromosome segregation ATPase